MSRLSVPPVDAPAVRAALEAVLPPGESAAEGVSPQGSLAEALEVASPVVPPPWPAIPQPKPPQSPRDSYRLADFTDLHDREFISQAYWGVLGRAPDAPGLAHYLQQLRSGAVSKPEILVSLRHSPEGRQRGATIRGLWPHFAFALGARLPGVGVGVRWLAALVGLVGLVRNLRAFETHNHRRQGERDALFNALSAQTAAAVATHEAALAEVAAEQRRAAARLDTLEAATQALGTRIVALEGRLATELARLEGQGEARWQAQGQREGRLVGRLAQVETGKADRGQLGEGLVQLERLKHWVTQLEAGKADDRAVARLAGRLAQVEAGKADRGQVGEGLARLERVKLANGHRLDTLDHRFDTLLGDLRGMAQQQHHLDAVAQDLQRSHWSQETLVEELQTTLNRLGEELRHDLAGLGLQLADQRRRWAALGEARGTVAPAPGPAAPAAADEAPSGAEAVVLDALYVTFEDQFRGSRGAIAANQRLYLDHLPDPAALPLEVVDLGCGRGEWLELLAAHGRKAVGVDSNAAMVRECRERGLDAVCERAEGFLARLAQESVAAVTGFHIVEHLPFEVLVALMEHSQRVLAPGGVAIFETPNPENLVVSGYTFHMDPTHRRPLPPPLLQHLATVAGFGRADILRRHPRREDSSDPTVTKWLCAPVDYALIARK